MEIPHFYRQGSQGRFARDRSSLSSTRPLTGTAPERFYVVSQDWETPNNYIWRFPYEQSWSSIDFGLSFESIIYSTRLFNHCSTDLFQKSRCQTSKRPKTAQTGGTEEVCRGEWRSWDLLAIQREISAGNHGGKGRQNLGSVITKPYIILIYI